jgi:competence protein ComEA
VGELRDRLSSLSRGEIIGLLAVVALTLGGGVLWYLRSLPQPVEVRAADRAQAARTSPSPSVPVLVDVAGFVRKPGVYEFVEGDRVIDAIEAAGGPRKGAELTGLNLASPLTDGQQVLVPEPVPASGTSVPGTTTAADGSVLVNINSADATALEGLSGIGEVLAQRIVDYREQNGPFATVDDLLDVSGIGDATLEEIRSEVTV